MTSYRFYTATTLDGFIADEHDSLDWLLTQPIDEQGPMSYEGFIQGVGALVMGHTTYQWVVDHESAQSRPWPYDLPCFVFTHRDLQPVADSIELLQGRPDEHRATVEAAAKDKDVWVVGGGDLAAQLARAGMLDEVIVSIAPVLLGSGRPLFTDAFDLDLQDYDRNRAFLCARYAVRGPRA